jgi:hypothetical protein
VHAQEKWDDRRLGFGFGLRSADRRGIAALVESCGAYANEARRLLPAEDADSVAMQFGQLRRGLESMLHTRLND